MATTKVEETLEQKGDRFYDEARAYMEKRNVRWSEACLEIKRRHPDANEAMQAASRARRARASG